MKRATEVRTICQSVLAISIHALVKRATTQIAGKEICVCISIHALVKRATMDEIAFETVGL